MFVHVCSCLFMFCSCLFMFCSCVSCFDHVFHVFHVLIMCFMFIHVLIMCFMFFHVLFMCFMFFMFCSRVSYIVYGDEHVCICQIKSFDVT